MTNQNWIFHITSHPEWEAARQQGSYQPESLAAEGFIHASTTEQVLRTAARFYAGRRDLVLLAIDPHKLSAELRYEDLAGEGLLFPHLYGALPLEAIVGWADFKAAEDGTFHFPQHFQPVI